MFLGERHGDATRRRGELMRERMQGLATRTNYPEVFHRSRGSSSRSVVTATVVVASDQQGASGGGSSGNSYHQKRTPEEMAEFVRLQQQSLAQMAYISNAVVTTYQSRQCEQRVALTREKQIQAQRQVVALKQERQTRSQLAGEAAPAEASQRLRARREKLRRTAEAELEALVDQQDSSLEAMNIARMLSPRFQERMEFAPAVAKYSAEEERVKQLLGTSRIGSYYQ